jgi:hypothetical protein
VNECEIKGEMKECRNRHGKNLEKPASEREDLNANGNQAKKQSGPWMTDGAGSGLLLVIVDL